MTSDDVGMPIGWDRAPSAPSLAGDIAWLRWSWDLDGPCSFSLAAGRLLRPGKRGQPPSLRDYLVHVHDDDQRKVQRILARTARERTPAMFEHRWCDAPGTALLWCSALGGEGDSAAHSPHAVLAVLLDVTDAVRHHHATDIDSIPALMTEIAQLTAAVQSRDLIGQAKGVLMERHHLNADDAFRMLRGLSHRSNTPIRELARRLVEGPVPPAPGPPRANLDHPRSSTDAAATTHKPGL